MKKFFKDVVGEIRNPSEDAAKILSVIGLLVCVILGISIVGIIIGFVQYALFINNEFNGLSYYLKENIQLYGLKNIMVLFGERFFVLLADIFLLIVCIKTIVDRQLCRKKIFIILLILKVLFPIAFGIYESDDFIKICSNFIAEVCKAGIIVYAFYNFKVQGGINEVVNDNTRIRNVSIFSYILFFTGSIPVVISSIRFVSYAKDYFVQYSEILEGVGIFDRIHFYYNITYYVLTYLVLLILVFTLIMRVKNMKSLKMSINTLFVIFVVGTLFGLPPYSLLPSNDILFLAIFIIATGYQNKYKVFDDLGKRIFNRTVEATKKGIDNYLSFKE